MSSESGIVVPDLEVHEAFHRHRRLVDVTNEPDRSVRTYELGRAAFDNFDRNVQVTSRSTSNDISKPFHSQDRVPGVTRIIYESDRLRDIVSSVNLCKLERSSRDRTIFSFLVVKLPGELQSERVSQYVALLPTRRITYLLIRFRRCTASDGKNAKDDFHLVLLESSSFRFRCRRSPSLTSFRPANTEVECKLSEFRGEKSIKLS